MVHEKIRRSQPTAQREWRPEERLIEGVPALPAEVIDSMTGPFGNSTLQNRASGLVSTGAVVRPADRRP
jgi:NADH-quinone oxidoreductase subunit B